MLQPPSDKLQFRRRRRFHLDLRARRNEPTMWDVPNLQQPDETRPQPLSDAVRYNSHTGTHLDARTPRACPDRRARIDQPEFITPVAYPL